jgi:hypothetical protein
MFEKRRAVLRAAALGYMLTGFMFVLGLVAAWAAYRRDPHRLAGLWEQWVTQPGNYGAGILGGLLVFGVALAGLVFVLGLGSRAARLHPTSAGLGAVLLVLGLGSLAVTAVWLGVVTPLAALQYQTARDPMARQALLYEARLAEHLLRLGLWSFYGFAAPGLFFLGRALRGERGAGGGLGWLPDSLQLAGAMIALHLPVTLYLMRESFLAGRYVRWLAVTDHLLLWGTLAVACFLASRWLHRVGFALPGERAQTAGRFWRE